MSCKKKGRSTIREFRKPSQETKELIALAIIFSWNKEIDKEVDEMEGG